VPIWLICGNRCPGTAGGGRHVVVVPAENLAGPSGGTAGWRLLVNSVSWLVARATDSVVWNEMRA